MAGPTWHTRLIDEVPRCPVLHNVSAHESRQYDDASASKFKSIYDRRAPSWSINTAHGHASLFGPSDRTRPTHPTTPFGALLCLSNGRAIVFLFYQVKRYYKNKKMHPGICHPIAEALYVIP